MRPINKGESPYKKINEYKDALPYLERRIGMYCSYCEFSIPHVPEVEHVVSKSKGGDLTDWNNLNLGCKYCNTRKKAQTMPENKKNYLWPDEDNTAIAYSYINGIPKVNEELLIKLDSTGDYLKRARNTYKLVGLGNFPTGKDRDRHGGGGPLASWSTHPDNGSRRQHWWRDGAPDRLIRSGSFDLGRSSGDSLARHPLDDGEGLAGYQRLYLGGGHR